MILGDHNDIIMNDKFKVSIKIQFRKLQLGVDDFMLLGTLLDRALTQTAVLTTPQRVKVMNDFKELQPLLIAAD